MMRECGLCDVPASPRKHTIRLRKGYRKNGETQNVRPLVWAHRGASAYAPENTLPAFRLAVEMHADGIELDVQLSADGKLIVCHDEKIDRTANGSGEISQMTLEELRTFSFAKKTKRSDTYPYLRLRKYTNCSRPHR